MTFNRNGDRWTLDCSDEEAEMILVSLKKNDDIQTESMAVAVDGVIKYQLLMHPGPQLPEDDNVSRLRRRFPR